MKWTSRLLFLLAISLSAAVIAMVSDQRSRSPESALDSIAKAIESDDFNHEAHLRSLALSLADSRANGSQELQIRSLTIRGDLLLKIGAAESALVDFMEISALLGTADEALLLRLAEAHVLSGDPDAGQRRIEALLSINPESTKAHVQEGRLFQASAKLLTDQCEVILQETLPYNELQEAKTLVSRLSAQDLLDTHRAGTVSSLRELFTEADGERLSRVLVLSDDASLFNRKARESLEESFRYGTDPVGVYEYIALFMRAQQPERATRFGAQARQHDQIAEHHPTTLQLIRAHIQAGDSDGAGTLAAGLIQATRDLTAQEYGDCCQALLLSKRWSGLFHAASRMRAIGTTTDGVEASLYLGLAQVGRKRYTNARTLLRTYATSQIPDPYPDSKYHAWVTLAELDRAAKQSFFERESVYAALLLKPDGADSSDLWVRLGELQLESGHSGLLLPLSSYAEALRLRPDNYDDVFETFKAVGAQALEAEGRDLELIYQDLLRERRSLPTIPLDAYSLWRLARRHARDGNYLAVVSVCRRMLDNKPNFRPAIDLMIDARLKLGRIRSATEQIVDRIDLIGLDKTSREFVRRLPADPFSKEQLHRVMRADPSWTGRLEIASRLRAEGSRREALSSLENAQVGAPNSSEIILLIARIHAEIGEREAALEKLSEIKDDDSGYPEALLLTARVASLAGDLDSLDAASASLQSLRDVSRLRELADLLIFDRRLQKAAPVLDALRELSGEHDLWRLERSILFHIVQSDTRRTREAADRAEAFTASPIPPLGRVLAATLAGDEVVTVDESKYLLEQFHQYSSLQALEWKAAMEGQVGEAILALFSGDQERTQALLLDATQGDELEPEWALVAAGLESMGASLGETTLGDDDLAHARRLINGSHEEPRNPREVLGVILAAQSPHFAPYALQRLNQYTQGERNAWDSYLIAKTLHRGGERLRARDALWKWTQPDSDFFAPAWSLFETFERERIGHYDHPDFDRLRAAMARSRARLEPKGLHAKVAHSNEALHAGNTKLALRAARAALDLDERNHQANAALARALSASGDPTAAITIWIVACETAPASYQARYITGALESMNKSISAPAGEVLPSVHAESLQNLSALNSNDPRIPLALAHIDLRQEADNPALGVARAFRRLDNFILMVDEVGLADLHPGAELDWLSFYLEYGPQQALEFCRSQLLLSPGALSLWLGEIRSLRTLGRHEEALDAAADVMKMGPSGELYEEIAACLQETGANPKQVERPLIEAHKLAGSLSVQAMLTRTKSLLAVKGEKSAGQAIASLSRVWDPKVTGPLNKTNSEVALLLSEGFMKRGGSRDYAQAMDLLSKVSRRSEDPYDRSLSRALAGLCAQETP